MSLYTTPDGVELVRLAVFGLLKEGCAEARAEAEAEGLADAADYAISVGLDPAVEQYVGGANPFPRVDVRLDSVEIAAGSATVNRRNRTARLELLCLAEGNSDGGRAAWRKANARAWKVARVVRRILEAEGSLYLGLRGVVSSHELSSFQAGQVDEESSSVWVCAVKISMKVDFVEGVEVASGGSLERVAAEVGVDG